MKEIKELLKILKEKARFDKSLKVDSEDILRRKIISFEDSLEEYKKIEKIEPNGLVKDYERYEQYVSLLNNVKELQYPSYLYEYIRCLAKPPYNLPTTLFNPEGAQKITIDIKSREERLLRSESAELALSKLYPGSVTYRYGKPAKILTGDWYQSYQADLSIHTLSSEPIFYIEKEGQRYPVYNPIKLNAKYLNYEPFFVCQRCLAIRDGDENCPHESLKAGKSPPSSSSLLYRKELGRSSGNSVKFRAPISFLIERATFLSDIEIGIAVTGFERKGFGKSVLIDYNPPLGIKLKTKGISFDIGVPEDFIDYIIQNKPHLCKNLFVQILAIKISGIMKKKGIPIYNLERILSGIIKGLNMEGTQKFDLSLIKNVFDTENIINLIYEESKYYEGFELDFEKVKEILNELNNWEIKVEDIKRYVYEVLIHTAAHTILIAGCITSGSLFDDIEYIIKGNEVILFDSVNGGNGTSEMIFEFLSSDEFDIKPSEAPDIIYRPKYFDEIITELLLPCSNSIAERVFHLKLPEPKDKEFQRRLTELHRLEKTHTKELNKIQLHDIYDLFPLSIGYHAVDSENIQDAEKFKELVSFCVHGCPECIIIGSKCKVGAFLGRYHVSKALFDELFTYITQCVTLNYDSSRSKIEESLRSHGVVILKGKSERNDVRDNILGIAAELDALKIGEGFVKFAGFWIDVPLGENKLIYSAMLVVI